MTRLTVAALGAAFAVSACAGSGSGSGSRPTAAAGASPPRQCFWPEAVSGFDTVDRNHLRVFVGAREVYELEVNGAGCLDVDWALGIGVRTRFGGGQICGPNDGEILYDSSTLGPQRCLITGVRRLGEDEIKAGVSGRAKPKGG